ncbi:MAG: glycosyl hydrolase, partial [Candidatus Sumerlaeota bacterium]
MPELSWKDEFKNPPRKNRTMPQWSWNGLITKERIEEQLDQFAAQGCGGLFMHARPGHANGYLTKEWFELWDYAMRYADKVGIDFHIYDEFTCPGGNAGGQVVSERPDVSEKKTSVRTVTSPEQVGDASVLACFRPVEDGAPEPLDIEAVSNASCDNPVQVILMEDRPVGRSFPKADLLRRETLEAFIQTTHEKYKAKSGDTFGKNVKFMFCDEPHPTAQMLPLSQFFFVEFLDEHGYELRDELGKLFFSQEGSEAVRYDYCKTLQRLFDDNFMKPLSEWCAENDLEYTGHIIENAFPFPLPHPDNMASLRWMQAPGIDLLGFQFVATNMAENGKYFFNMREVSSLVSQFGRDWLMVESCGGPGYHTAFELFKPLEDYLLALGTNVMDPHLAHQTLIGGGKFDFPHTLSDHSPWWKYYYNQAEHVARANTALCQGRETNRVLVLHPSTSTWAYMIPGAKRSKYQVEEPELRKLEQLTYELMLDLYGKQIDFDLGSELVMEEVASVEDGKMRVGKAVYDVVIVPQMIDNLTSATLELFEDYIRQGGTLWSLRGAPTRLDGRLSDAPSELFEKNGAVRRFSDNADLVATLREKVPPRLTGPKGEALPSELLWRRVENAEGEIILFFSNPWGETMDFTVRLEDPAAWALDTATGESTPLETFEQDGETLAEISLPSRGHALWIVKSGADAERAEPKPGVDTAVEVTFQGAATLEENRLFVEYADIEGRGGHSAEGLYAPQCDNLNWQWQGFEGGYAWGGQQFKQIIRNRKPDPRGAFTVRYRFTVGEDVPDASLNFMRVAVERPWLYVIDLNGETLDQAVAERWFDPDMRALPIGNVVRRGQNVLTLRADAFHPFHMIA